MKKFLWVIVAVLLFSSVQIKAQDSLYVGHSVGVGLGMDYGGFGFRYTHSANRTLGLFGALGFNLLGPGVNAGLITRLAPGYKTCPYLLGMYGYNAVVKVQGASKYDKTYFGPTLGFGIEFHGFIKTKNFFNCELLVPIRSSSFYDDIDTMKDNGVEFKSGPIPIAFSLGYHFGG